MFDAAWTNRRRWLREQNALALAKPAPPLAIPVVDVALLAWEEHCIECAVPQCFGQCPLYQARADRRCLRSEYGFVHDPRYSGLWGCGIDLRFRRWSKIETVVTAATVPRGWLRWMDRMNRVATGAARALSWLPVLPARRRRATWALEHLRRRMLVRCGSGRALDFTEFVLEGYNLEANAVHLVVQGLSGATETCRHVLDFRPGYNLVRIPWSQFCFDPSLGQVCLAVFPAEDCAPRMIFTWLDLVRLRAHPGAGSGGEPPPEPPAAKVKCVAWDLDNTLWSGILVEDGPERIRLRPEVLAVIQELDQRGIIHTIVSKNTHEQAWAVLQALGLADYFVFPAINWGSKSANLRQVAKRINIGLDSFAFVDDTPFERSEIASQLPMVRVYSDRQAATLPRLPEFCQPITEMSRQRRASYLAEMQREEFRAERSGDNLDYLKSCVIRMQVFRPESQEECARCLELVQRSNQLNLSAHRYGNEEFSRLLADNKRESFGIRVFDRFGAYGVVGFLSVELGAEPELIDLVISCRVAKRHVEHALFKWLGRRYLAQKRTSLGLRLIRTPRNYVLAEIFQELPMDVIEHTDSMIRYQFKLSRYEELDDLVQVVT